MDNNYNKEPIFSSSPNPDIPQQDTSSVSPPISMYDQSSQIITPQETPQSKKSNNKKLFIAIILGILIVVIIAIIVIILLMSPKEQNNSDNQSNWVPAIELLGKRDSSRKNDINRVASLMTQYQDSHTSNPLGGPSYWRATDPISCDSANLACNITLNYFNLGPGDSDNNFIDPSGVSYSVYITENFAENDSLTTSFGNNSSKLVLKDNGYSIGGTSPFNEHIIYIIPGADCLENVAVKGTSASSFAVLYQLEDGTVYCAN